MTTLIGTGAAALGTRDFYEGLFAGGLGALASWMGAGYPPLYTVGKARIDGDCEHTKRCGLLCSSVGLSSLTIGIATLCARIWQCL